MARHAAAIHAIAAKLHLSEDDRRALQIALTGKASCKDMSEAEQQRVRDHLQGLAARCGVGQPVRGARLTFEQRKALLSPQQRLALYLWGNLKRQGKIEDGSARALDAWVRHQTEFDKAPVDALRFCTKAQLNTVIEKLKQFEARA
ncbi:MAG TPA: regulatory protein GemA [Burkholderiaceae bacterium]|nr:regulatory protein GemA [Burkholderiaceae bacterium]